MLKKKKKKRGWSKLTHTQDKKWGSKENVVYAFRPIVPFAVGEFQTTSLFLSLSQKLLKESQSSILLFKFQASSLQNSIYKLHFINPVSLSLHIYICISTNWMPSVLDSHWFQVRLLNFYPIIFNVIYIFPQVQFGFSFSFFKWYMVSGNWNFSQVFLFLLLFGAKHFLSNLEVVLYD